MYKSILILILLISVWSCSKDEESTKHNVSEIEKNLQNDINETKSKYDELDEYQKIIRDDIQNQVISIGCSTNRLLKLKSLEGTEFKNKIIILINKTKLLDAYIDNAILIKNRLTYNYKYRPNLTVNLKDISFYDNKDYYGKNGEIAYLHNVDKSEGIYNGEADDLITLIAPKKDDGSETPDEIIIHYRGRVCSKLYKRAIPNSNKARMTESKAFEDEIAYAIKRIDSFEERIEVLEQLASQFTIYEGRLKRELQEYQIEKSNSAVAQAYIDNFKKTLADAEEKIKLLKQNSKIQVTDKEAEAIRDIFIKNL